MTDLQKKTAEAIVNIFETGRVHGRYGAVAVLKGDTGHLSYGRSQAALGSGSLYLLLKAYCDAEGARFASNFRLLLTRFRNKDVTLDFDQSVRALLAEAGDDPVMQKTQDEFFDRGYWQPAVRNAAGCGLKDPLSIAVVYDSHIQGGFARIRDRVPGGPCISAACPEQAWIAAYIAQRRSWLSSCNDPLPKTVYRVDEFSKLVGKNPNLDLPLTIRGVYIDDQVLGYEDAGEVPARIPEPATMRPILQLTRPYTRSEDVKALKAALTQHGFGGDTDDDVFGPMTSVLVRKFQAKMGLRVDGIAGPGTWQALDVRAAAATS